MKIKADSKNKVTFNNRVDYCIGTGRMGLALTKEYYEELKLTQEEIGFSHIRGHGLFTDDMAIYHDFTFNGKISLLLCVLFNISLKKVNINLVIRIFIHTFAVRKYKHRKRISYESSNCGCLRRRGPGVSAPA